MAGWCSASPAVQAMPLVGAALSADREQARSYRFWGLGLDGVGWQNPCGSWLASDGIAAVWLPDRSYRFWGWVWIVSVGSTLVGAGLPAMASLRSGCRAAVSADREQARSYRFWGLGLGCVGWQNPCGSWLASDGVAAVWLSDRSYRFWVFFGGVAGINPGQAL